MKPRALAPILFLALACSSVSTTPPPVARDGSVEPPPSRGRDAREKGQVGASCRDDNDCVDRCYQPVPRIGAGADGGPPVCYQQCQTDGDCNPGGTSGSICSVGAACVRVDLPDGGRISDIRVCVPGCRVRGCLPEETCGADDHCVLTTCSRDADCPSNFACTADHGGAPTCHRRACTRDDQCQGACVQSLCYEKAGTCGPPPG